MKRSGLDWMSEVVEENEVSPDLEGMWFQWDARNSGQYRGSPVRNV